jgi:hypothetical protein
MKKTFNRLAIVVTSTVALVGLAACASGNGPAGSSDGTVTYHMDYPAYDSADSLYQTADLVVEANLTGSPQVRQLGPAANVDDPKLNPKAGTGAQPDGEPLVTTVYRAAVTRVYKGAVKVGDTVEVKQLGGQFKGVTYRAEGATMLKSGSAYLLFLAVFPDAPASLLNPNQAQYTIDSTGRPASVGDNTLTVSPADLTRLSAAK